MWHSWQRTACLVLSALALLFIFVAFVTPGWLILNLPSRETTNAATIESTVSIGLWYAVLCEKETGKTEDCESKSYASLKDDLSTSIVGYDGMYLFTSMAQLSSSAMLGAMVEAEVEATLGLLACIVGVFCVFTAFTSWCESWYCCSIRYFMYSAASAFLIADAFYDGMVEAEVEATLGLFACIVAVFCVFIAFTYWCESWYCCSIRYYMSSAAVAFLVAGVLVWIPTGRFARANDILDNYTGIKIGVPYSVILMAIGGILAFLVMFLLVWMLCTETQGRHSRKRRYSDSDYGDYNNHYSKYDERNTRPYSISDPPRYEKPRPSRYPEPRSLPPPPRVYEKRPPDYHHNYAYDSSLPRRHHAFHFDDYPRRNDNPSPYRGHSWYDRNMRY
ncbi:hypothetical protein ScPMuIL_004641 [Solemya velum]